MERRPGWDRDRRLLQGPGGDRVRVRAGRDELRRHPPRHGHRGSFAHRTAGIDRRNKAIKLLQDWAAANGRTMQIQYTLPTSASGLETSGLAVLQNAVTNHVRIDVVNPMVFDYYDRVTTDMGGAAVSASNGLHAQLHTLLPAKTPATALGDAGRHDHERSRRLPPADRGYRPRRRAAAAGLRQRERDEHALDVGDPARQRRVPRDDGRRTIAPGSSRGRGSSVTPWSRSRGRRRPTVPQTPRKPTNSRA